MSTTGGAASRVLRSERSALSVHGRAYVSYSGAMRAHGPFVVLAVSTLASIACRPTATDTERSAPAASASTGSPGGATPAADSVFVARRDVDAVDQPESHHVVGHLTSGKSYALVKRGGPGSNWCKVDVG